jgi:hypothetical protein
MLSDQDSKNECDLYKTIYLLYYIFVKERYWIRTMESFSVFSFLSNVIIARYLNDRKNIYYYFHFTVEKIQT